MSFDDYAEHIYQKHRLSVAIAILKTKPPNLTSYQYIEQLKSKMADNMGDDDVTICSDDFMMDDDDDSITILENFDENFGDDCEMDVLNHDGVQVQPSLNLPKNLSQTTYYNSQESQPIQRNISNNDCVYYENDLNAGQQFYIKDNLSKNADISQDLDKIAHSKDITANNYINSSTNETKKAKTINLDETYVNSFGNTQRKDLNKPADSYYDSQKTILYTVPNFNDYSHCSPSQNPILVPNKYLYSKNEGKNKLNETQGHENDANLNGNVVVHSQNDDILATKQINNDLNKDTCKSTTVLNENNTRNTNEIQNKLALNMDDDTEADLQSETILNTQINNIIKELDAPNDKSNEQSQNINKYFNEIHNLDENRNICNTNSENSHQIQELPQNSVNNYQNFNEVDIQMTNEDPQSQNFENIDQYKEKSDDFETAEEEESAEVIPYKVLEEFNKIKLFLRRKDRKMSCDGYSSDSGYRSDSQIRSSNRSALQLSGLTINQSAFCILHYLMQCHLVVGTRDITSEIAQVKALGQLIDRLHEEESYPQFLEELLETIGTLLRQLSKGENSNDSEFLKKEEFFQRLLLLNKSIHIQKHSIEKITEIVSKFHEKITEKNVTYELINVNEIEDMSYIFHLLELLLKKYVKNKNISSQASTQMSQDEDRNLKKSSITDIWRKKWNPNFQENNEGSKENHCILKDCSEILNRIVVDCVDCYSLVAFSALKCFNIMQS